MKIVALLLDKLQPSEFFEFLIPESARSALQRTQRNIDFSLILPSGAVELPDTAPADTKASCRENR
ncbi:hypothetical protein C7B67_29140 [filamentous cyanobacterium Phorm 6]|nr:hypothetical protein C7B67_29140 [filamentous cyanobacterium Phorm 6]